MKIPQNTVCNSLKRLMKFNIVNFGKKTINPIFDMHIFKQG